MTRIDIKKEFAQDWISREAGERLRHLILQATKEGKTVEIDFSGLIIASTSFLDEGLAKLIEEGWSTEEITSRVHCKNLHPRDREVLNKLIEKQCAK